MALAYTNSGSSTTNGLFDDLGAIAKAYNDEHSAAADIAANLAAVISELQEMSGGDPQALLARVPALRDQWRQQAQSRKSSLALIADSRLKDATVVDELGNPNGTQAILLELAKQMIADGESIAPSVVTLGSVAAPAGYTNVGDGTVLRTLRLDGVSAPSDRVIASTTYHGFDSEIAASETMRLECISDSYSGASEGSESWRWSGAPSRPQHSPLTEGSGEIGTIRGLHEQTQRYITNPSFDLFASDLPVGWTATAGVAVTNFAAEASSVFRAGNALKIITTGGATYGLKQLVAPSRLIAGRMYAIACRAKASASFSQGTLEIIFSGTGYTAGANKISQALSGISTSAYQLVHAFVLMPWVVPSDFAIEIKLTGTPTTGRTLYLDDLTFGEVTYGGGVGLAVVRGSTPWARGDRLEWTAANDEAGTFQKFFRQAFGVQLPSDASPTIADSLAE